MPVRTLSVNDLPRKQASGIKPWERWSEWMDALAVLSRGMKPLEALEVQFPSDGSYKVKHPDLVFLRNITKHIKKLGIPVDAYRRGRCIYIVGRSSQIT